MTLKGQNIILSIVTIAIIGIAVVYLIYDDAIGEANEEGKKMKCKENTEQSFTGTITEVNRYEYSSFMNKNFFALSIKTADSINKFIDYQFNLETSENVLDFAKVGQTIIKHKGIESFDLIDDQGIEGTFKVPDCE